MFKSLRTLSLVALFALLALPVFAVTVATMGAPSSSGDYPITIDHNGQITIAATASQLVKYEVATTSDTLVAGESGKTFIVEPVSGSPAFLDLPDANVGMEFTFTQGNTTKVGGANASIYLNPQDTDFIIFVNSDAGSSMSAGDGISNTNGYTGDSVRLICPVDLYWYATDVRGTWADTD